MKAPSETPLGKSQRLARELTSDPVAAAMIKQHVSTGRLIELLELTEEDFLTAFPALTDDGK
ncbi:MAG: hypothetical protein ACO3IN_04570 [Steroidobacteraceae bacterium]